MRCDRGFALLAGLAAVVSAPSALAEAAAIPLPEMVKRSDLIARVRVISTQPLGSRAVEGYASLARVRVRRLLKGPAVLREVNLLFDNGLACPNVYYQAGEECLVFLHREKNGRYSTFYTHKGKYPTTPKIFDLLRKQMAAEPAVQRVLGPGLTEPDRSQAAAIEKEAKR